MKKNECKFYEVTGEFYNVPVTVGYMTYKKFFDEFEYEDFKNASPEKRLEMLLEGQEFPDITPTSIKSGHVDKIDRIDVQEITRYDLNNEK